MVFSRVAKCILSPHFQVAERALYFWNNERFLALLKDYAENAVPLMFPVLFKQSKAHWSKSILALISNALKMLWELSPAGFEQCSQHYKAEVAAEKERQQQRLEAWHQLELMANQNPAAEALAMGASTSYTATRLQRQSTVDDGKGSFDRQPKVFSRGENEYEDIQSKAGVDEQEDSE